MVTLAVPDPKAVTFMRAASRMYHRRWNNDNCKLDYLKRRYAIVTFKPEESEKEAANSTATKDTQKENEKEKENETQSLVAAKHEVELNSVSMLPLPIQLRFRRRMWSLFAVQVLLVWIVVGILRWPKSTANTWLETNFRGNTTNGTVTTGSENHFVLLGIPFAVVIALLVLMYMLRRHKVVVWPFLILFSLAQAFLFASAAAHFDSYIGVASCGFTFFMVVFMVLLSGLGTHMEDGREQLMSPYLTGFIAYAIVAFLATVVHACVVELLTGISFAVMLVCQLLLMLWLCWDARQMYRVMAPVEYVHGVIYLYTDVILVSVILLAMAGIVVLVTSGDVDSDDLVGKACEETIDCCVGESDDPAGPGAVGQGIPSAAATVMSRV